jgi:hypothetical protein
MKIKSFLLDLRTFRFLKHNRILLHETTVKAIKIHAENRKRQKPAADCDNWAARTTQQ